MASAQRTPYHRQDDNELLGFIEQGSGDWQAQTIFGYTIARTLSRTQAEAVLRERGLSFLTGTWQYFDSEEQDWFPCILKEASERRVTVIRTSALGYQEPGSYKMVTINNPDDTKLVKSQ